MLGYSGKPLTSKLGYLTGDTVYLSNPPKWFKDVLTAEGISIVQTKADWGHGFFTNQASLDTFLSATKLESFSKGFWVSWPKKASGIATDLTEQSFRDIILPLGWVDTKVCAIDEIWSGLKFLRRKA